MDERKSVLTNNQAVENLEQDCQYAKWSTSNGVTENADDAAVKHYNRDILLQLRLHPLSLQKPRELPEMEVIKDKLYLNDITDKASSSEKHMDSSNYHTSVKPDYCSIKPDFPLLSPYLNRVYPYSYSSHAYNGTYQSAPLKCRSSFNTYNPLKKHCIAAQQCLKDFSVEECPWMKHFPTSDDMWNCYSNHMPSGSYKRKEHLEAVPKTKKKLSIIDPVTGKDILETVRPSELEQSSVGENSESVENHLISKQFCADPFCSTNEKNEEAAAHKSNETICDSLTFSSDDKTCFEELGGSSAEFQVDVSAKSIKNILEASYVTTSSTEDNSQDAESTNQKDVNIESSEAKNTVPDFAKISENAPKYDSSKYSKKVAKDNHNREMNTHFDVHGMCRAHHMKECHIQVCNENLSNQHDPVQESIRQLREKTYSLKYEEQKMAILQREKTYSLKQEEQKIAILQSFLRYKKYQLEESARNLDEKRIEIANWEYSLYNKAKKLQEKENWLENKNEMLSKKTQQLIEKEKILCEENRSDILYPNAFKEADIADKKFGFDSNDTIWNEISKMKNPRMDENNQYSFVRYDSKPAKIPEDLSSNVEKCKSDAFSLDELEKNLVFIEKLHSSSEINDSTINKIEMASSPNAVQKSDENASYDPLGYSKGRRYLPEHIKYWLDKRDKNAL